MWRSRIRLFMKAIHNKYGVGSIIASYLSFATVSAAAISLGISASLPSDKLTRLSAADFSEIGNSSDKIQRFVTPTFDEEFWNGGDMANDKHWRRSRRTARRQIRIRRDNLPLRINLQIPSTPGFGSNRNSNLNTIVEGYSEGTYRTVCVRMCDGYYWPISFNGENGRSRAKDANICRNSCGSPTRLFIDNNPGTDIDQMVDDSGRPYSKLKNAYRYRNEYVSNCKCKADPWEVASINRHKYYALVNQAKKNRAVAKVLRKQKRKIKVAKRKSKQNRKKEWRRIAKVEGFWAKAGDTRYSLGAKEVPYTDDDGYPIEVLSSRPRSSKSSRSKFVRRQEPKTRSKYVRMGNPFSVEGGNFADPSTILNNATKDVRSHKRKSLFTRRSTTGRMRLRPATRRQSRQTVRRSGRSARPKWAREAFGDN